MTRTDAARFENVTEKGQSCLLRALGKIAGHMGYALVSKRDRRLLRTVHRQLLPEACEKGDGGLAPRIVGNADFLQSAAAQRQLLDSLRGREFEKLFRCLREDREINAGYMGRDFRPQGLIHNGYYPTPDAEIYAAMIVRNRPEVIIEVGSGYSTAVARAAIEQAGIGCILHVIDPQPRRAVETLADRIEYERVERSSLGDHAFRERTLLFIDSSHVCRSGGDLPFLYCHLLPGLPPGVLVHVHDVYLPYDYPPGYAERFYSEQYLLHTLLSRSPTFEVLLATHFMSREHPETMQAAFGPAVGADPLFFGASFWFQTVC
jgi:hypothetical protein